MSGCASRVPGAARSHIPAGRPLWSLHEECLVVMDAPAEGVVTVATRWAAGWAGIDLPDVGPTAREVLRRMSLGPVSLENVPGLDESYRNWRHGTGDCAAWRRVKAVLDRLGGCVVPSLGLDDGGGPVLSLVASTADTVFTLPAVDVGRRVRIRAGASVTTVRGEAVLAGPGGDYAVVLHRSPARVVAEALLGRSATTREISADVAVGEPLVTDIVAYLGGARLLDGPGAGDAGARSIG